MDGALPYVEPNLHLVKGLFSESIPPLLKVQLRPLPDTPPAATGAQSLPTASLIAGRLPRQQPVSALGCNADATPASGIRLQRVPSLHGQMLGYLSSCAVLALGPQLW